jgi:hypothetical protein
MTTIVERVELGGPHRSVIAHVRHAIAGRVVDDSGAVKASSAGKSHGGTAVRIWASIIVVAVTALHLYQVPGPLLLYQMAFAALNDFDLLVDQYDMRLCIRPHAKQRQIKYKCLREFLS